MNPPLYDIAQLISTVGFPIAASVAMFYLYNKTVTGLTETLTSMNHTLSDLKNELIKKRGETQ